MSWSDYYKIDTTSTTTEWYTPPFVFRALGCQFDLDPASPGAAAVPWIPACRHITKEEDGLAADWGNAFVFMNCPYGLRLNNMQAWLDKFVEHGNGVCLTPERTSTAWWQNLSAQCDLILFSNKKIPFIAPALRKTSSAVGSTFMAIGSQGVAALTNAERNGLGRLCRPIKLSLGRRARAIAAINNAKPWETVQDIAARAGVHRNTITNLRQRLLQSAQKLHTERSQNAPCEASI